MRALAADGRALLRFFERLPGPTSIGWMMAGLLLGWWLYVPIHELLHVAGCLLAGGEVSRLEVAPIYGGSLLAAVFPFVVSGSDYAGQLTGFETGGSDLVYQATVLMPYLLTVFPGFWLWQRALSSPRPGWRATLAVGGLLPVVAAPLISWTGDYYESASILVSRAFAGAAGRPVEAWRSDDVFRLVADGADRWTAIDALAIGAGVVLALVLALATMQLGAWIGAGIAARTGHDRNRTDRSTDPEEDAA